MHEAILNFLDNETKAAALAVYEAYFDSYRITLKGGSNLFIEAIYPISRVQEEGNRGRFTGNGLRYRYSIVP